MSMLRLRTLPALLIAAAFLAPGARAEQTGYTDAPYAAVLETFVDDAGFVDYARLQQQPDDLLAYLDRLAGLDRATFDTWPEADQIALLINAYNAFTLKAIVDHYPIHGGPRDSWRYPRNSIRQIPGVWTGLAFELMGEQWTLDGIEHDWLREDYNEPRIHMAVNCASVGCPPLRREPYRGDVLDQQLEEQTRRFVSNPRWVRINTQLRVVSLSPLMRWYADDFRQYAPDHAAGLGDERAAELGVLYFISRYMDESIGESLRGERYVVGYLGYDWSLNEQPADD